MQRSCALSLVTVLGMSLFGWVGDAKAAEPQLAHMVFFTLAEDTPANREQLIAACNKYLSDHDGTVYFSAGAIVDELDREVNDRDFDVALHLVFADKAAHDKYQTHPQHLRFIEANKELWSTVRVFDSYIAAPKAGPLPVGGQGFAGLLRGKVVGKEDGVLLVAVSDVVKSWQNSKAENPQTLVGQHVRVKGRDGAAAVAEYIALVRPGETVVLDVNNREGDVLHLVELNADQRARNRGAGSN